MITRVNLTIKTANNKWLAGFIILGFILFFSFLISTPSFATAVVGFEAGHIIDDSVFTNSNSMNVSQIQAFLNSKVPACDTWHEGFTGSSGTYYSPPFTCLKDYTENGLSAAQIIYNISQQYQINPQVFIVLLQKEQGLITDTWPASYQYRSATGYACGDNSACETAYYGLTRQLYWAATLFHTVVANSQSWSNPYRSGTSWYSPYILGNNTIYYNPGPYNEVAKKYYGSTYDKDGNSIPDITYCGGTTVNIQNRATQSLYNYTPYQPNASALNAGYGEGDVCGAYGNRNFYQYFKDWFGSTREIYRYSFETLIGTTGSVISANIDTDIIQSLTIGDTMYVFYNNKNIGTLEYALYKNNAWNRYILDGPSSSIIGSLQTTINISSITAFDFLGQPQLFYTDDTTKTVRHGFISDGVFHIETLDGTAGSVTKSSRQLGSAISGFDFGNGHIQLYYYDTSNNSLVHTWWNGQVWGSETLDGTAGSVTKSSRQLGSAISGFDFGNGHIQLYYYDTSNGELVHTWFTTQWNTEIMDGTTASLLGNAINSGERINFQLINGSIFIMYYDDAANFSEGRTSAWRIAYTNGSWVSNILDGGNTSSKTGSASNLPISTSSSTQYNGSIQIFYTDSNSNLKHAWLNRQN